MFGFTKRDSEYRMIEKMVDRGVRRVTSRTSRNGSSPQFIKNYSFGAGGSLNGGDNLTAENVVQVLGYENGNLTQTTRNVIGAAGMVYIDLTSATVARFVADAALDPHTWAGRY